MRDYLLKILVERIRLPLWYELENFGEEAVDEREEEWMELREGYKTLFVNLTMVRPFTGSLVARLEEEM
jgi:hypothetical protein